MLGLFSSLVFLGLAQRRLIRNGLPIYMYHKIARPPAGTADPFLFTSPEEFDRQLGLVVAARLAPSTLTATVPVLAENHSRAVITFDDGCVDVLENGLPILRRHGFRAIQFLVAGSLGGINHWDVAKGDVPAQLMTESQIREWLAGGQEIGSHSMTHRNLRHAQPAELRLEIFDSKKLLEDRFGQPIEHFSYPFGLWNESVRDLVMEAGYKTACTASFGVNPPGTSPFELRRIIPLSAAQLSRKIVHRARRRY
jgi:peptidoglycan/xylan/chitin deacetylase (PgdA/CDA1 family)